MNLFYQCRILLAFTLVTSAAAAVPGPFALLHSLVDPSTNALPGTRQGCSVAIDGNIAVAGALDSGAVKIYDATTGVLLHTLANPNHGVDDKFGASVAISGAWVVVGAVYNNTGGSLAGIVHVYNLAGATPTVPFLTLTNPSPASSQNFGASVGISGPLVVIGSATDDTGAPDAGRAYVYNMTGATPAVPLLMLNNPSPEQSDFFGKAVAISGTRVVIGADGDNTGVSDAGSAYVFDLANATPTLPMLTLTNPSPTVRGSFGFSVDISGSWVVVGGAFRGGMTGLESGGGYVYDLLSIRPAVPVLVVTNTAPDFGGYFASSVAISGKWLVIGSYRNEGIAFDRGNAFVYDLTSATPGVPALTLTNPAPAGNDQFAFALAISGTKVVVGAFGENAGAAETGSAYVFELSSSTPTLPAATLNHPSLSVGNSFGSAVSISGNRLVVGAPWDDAGATDAGVVYVYELSSTVPPVPVLTLTNPSSAAGDLFGNAVSISGHRVVVGALRNDTGTNDAGIAYVYDLSGATPGSPTVTLTNPSPSGHDSFGSAVAIFGERVVVGTPFDQTGPFYAGSVYVYDLAGATPATPVLKLTSLNPTGSDYFGYAVAISGTRVVVGAFGYDDVTHETGIAYVYDLAAATPAVPVATLHNPKPDLGLYFGLSVGISGTRVVVGADRAPGLSSAAGGAYVYDLAGAVPTVPIASLLNPNPAQNDDFGHAVAISGTHVVVGASRDTGSVYVYDLLSTTPALPVATLRKPTPAAWDQFSSSVAIDGTTIVAGAPYDDTNATDRGAAYIFGLQPALSIAPAPPGFANISWTPATSSGFILQYADRLTPANWANAPSGAANPVIVSITNASRFYRLFQP